MNLDTNNKKIYKKVLVVLLVLGLFFVGIIGYGVYWVFFDWSRFKQELIAESTSPEGTYTIHAYRYNGGATTSYAVIGELEFNKKHKKAKKIYWQYKEEEAVIEWIDDNTVIINDVQLEIPYETYDYRKGIK